VRRVEVNVSPTDCNRQRVSAACSSGSYILTPTSQESSRVVRRYVVAESEVELSAIRSQGPGGQHVNKTSTAVHLRFDISASGLPLEVKQRMLALADTRISSEGVLVIKAQGTRSLENNKAEAMGRLNELIEQAFHVPKRRRPTKPTFGSRQRRLEGKSQRSVVKSGRGKVDV
jgi:ribosome-associated protein